MSKSVFISYTHDEQSSFIAELANDIALFDCIVWYDEELRNKGGQEWWNIICEKIRECDIFVYVAVNEYFLSAPCHAELTYATELNKQLLPITLGNRLDFQKVPTKYQKDNFLMFKP